jgi:hypothetical protein
MKVALWSTSQRRYKRNNEGLRDLQFTLNHHRLGLQSWLENLNSSAKISIHILRIAGCDTIDLKGGYTLDMDSPLHFHFHFDVASR